MMSHRLFALGLVLATAHFAHADTISIDAVGSVYEFKVNGQVVTKYHTGKEHAKPFLWPLNAPGGIVLTRDWPMRRAATGETTDHPHQKSAWFCHGDVIPEGMVILSRPKGVRGVDFWAEGQNCGRIECTNVQPPTIGSDRASLRTSNAWKTSEGRVILFETRLITLIPLTDANLILVKSELRAGPNAITFGDTKEGSFGVRINDKLSMKSNPKSVISNAVGGKGEAECWGRKAEWCDYSGTIDDKAIGISIFDHPDNPYRACWHVRSYGLMAANPFGRAESGFPAQKGTLDPLAQLKPDQTLTLKYGLLLHTGDAQSGKVAERFRKFRAMRE